MKEIVFKLITNFVDGSNLHRIIFTEVATGSSHINVA